MVGTLMRRRCVTSLFAFGLAIFGSLFADDRDPQRNQDSEKIREWIDEGIHHFETTGEIPKGPAPEFLLDPILRFSENKSEEFQNQLEMAFAESIRTWYPRFYNSPTFSDVAKIVPVEAYLREFLWVSEIVEKKEERFFGRNDVTAIDRIGLKVAFTSRFGSEAWDEFKVQFRSAWHSARDSVGTDPAAQEQALWACVSVRLREFLKSRSSAEEVELEVSVQEFLDEVKAFGEVLVKHDKTKPLFVTALQLSHLISYSKIKGVSVRSLLKDKTFADFLHEVSLEYEGRATKVVRKFLETAELGKFREQNGPFSRIRVAAIKTNGEHHLLFRADVANGKASIVITNPPHRLQKGGLLPSDPKLIKFARRVKKNVILLDLSKSGARPNEKYSLTTKAVLLRPSAWNPKRYLGDWFIWAYEHPSWGQAFLASGSLLINGGLRVKALQKASEISPEHFNFNLWAVGLVLTYYFGCELFKRWYDNAFAAESLFTEAIKKTLFAMFFTGAVFVWLTQDVSIGTAILLTLPINLIDKVLASLSQRMIRSAEREGVIRGDFVLFAGDFSSSYWKEYSDASRENYLRQSRNVLRNLVYSSSVNGLTPENFHRALDGLGISWSERFKAMSYDFSGLSEIPQISSEAELVPEESGMLREDLLELEANYRAQYDRESAQIVEDGREVPRPRRRGMQVTPRFENGLLARFFDGNWRNWFQTLATTNNPVLGPILQVGYGILALSTHGTMVLRARNRHQSSGNQIEVERYNKELKNLVPILPWLFVKATSGCRKLISWVGRSEREKKSSLVK